MEWSSKASKSTAGGLLHHLWKEYQQIKQEQLRNLRLFQDLHLAIAHSNDDKEKAKQLQHAPDNVPDDEEIAAYQHSEGQASWLISFSQDWTFQGTLDLVLMWIWLGSFSVVLLPSSD